MSAFQFRPINRGAVYRAPRMRIYHYPIISVDASSATASQAGRQDKNRWRPVKLSWSINGEPSTLTFKRLLGRTSYSESRQRPEDVNVAAGDLIRLIQTGLGGSLGGRRLEWFRGYVAGTEITIEPDSEDLTITAHGPEIRLQGKVVSGRWHKTAGADDAEILGTLSADQAVRNNIFQSDLPAIFNESGRPNASKSNWRLASDATSVQDSACKVFEPVSRKVFRDGSLTVEAVHWTAYNALRSLVEFCDDYELISPHTPWRQIEELLGQTPIGEVAVEGMNLLEAIRAVLRPVGFGFAIEPWTVANGRDKWGLARHRLIVFSLRNPRTVKSPRLEADGGNVAIHSAAGRRAEVQRISLVRDSRRPANDITVIGAQKRLQVVLEFNDNAASRDLHPLWDTDEHDLSGLADNGIVDPWQWSDEGGGFEDFADMYNRSGKDHLQHRHALRSFAWNEDGSFASIIDVMPDLSTWGVGADGFFVRRPRPIASTFVYDADGQRVRVHARKVQLGIVGDDDAWIDVPAEIWNDRAGFTISTDQLAGSAGDGQWYPYASHDQYPSAYRNLHYLTLLHNSLGAQGQYRLRLRLIGSIECDQAVRGSAPRQATSVWPFRAERVLRFGRRFQWREIRDDPFAGAAQNTCIDDSLSAAVYAEQIRDAADGDIVRGSVVLRYLTRSYSPGDGISRTDGRVVDLLGAGVDQGRCPVVVAMTWDFREGVNKTELLLDSPESRVAG